MAGTWSVKSSQWCPSFSNNMGRRRHVTTKQHMRDSSTCFVDAWNVHRLSAKKPSSCSNGRHALSRKRRELRVVDELGGQYEDTFNDVKMVIIEYFTFKAVRTVLEQLCEMNPPQYEWFDNFVEDYVPNEGTRFLQALLEERQELAERVMITRLTLYAQWIKRCDHGEIYKEISEDNLKLMRERLLETIIWPSDDTSPDRRTD